MSVARRGVANSLETAPRELELKVGQIGRPDLTVSGTTGVRAITSFL